MTAGLSFVALTPILLACTASAALTWSAGSPANPGADWNTTATNWTSGTEAWAQGDTAVFPSSGDSNANITENIEAVGVTGNENRTHTINNNSGTNTLSIGATGFDNGKWNINVNVILTANSNWGNGANGFFIMTGDLKLNASTTLVFNQRRVFNHRFLGNITGDGAFDLNDNNSATGIITTDFRGTNSYTGGTTVTDGNLRAAGSSVNAFGTGNVTVVDNTAKLTIQTGATNAINDMAQLLLGTGAIVDLEAGVIEAVGGLTLGSDVQGPGFYGSTAAVTANGFGTANDTFFTGDGLIQVVPEPTSALLTALGALGLLRRKR